MKRTYYPNYFSIDDIIVTQEKIPCITEQVKENEKLKNNLNNLQFIFIVGIKQSWILGSITFVNRFKSKSGGTIAALVYPSSAKGERKKSVL